MPSKQQIMPVKVFAPCETYNCSKKAVWAVGRPDGPRQLWHYYCDDCMRNIIANIPKELMPQPNIKELINTLRTEIEKELGVEGPLDLDSGEVIELLIDYGFFAEPKEIDLLEQIKQDFIDLPSEKQAEFMECVTGLKSPDQEQEPKIYTCKYCGESFDTPAKVAGHTRYCQAKKEAENSGNQ